MVAGFGHLDGDEAAGEAARVRHQVGDHLLQAHGVGGHHRVAARHRDAGPGGAAVGLAKHPGDDVVDDGAELHRLDAQAQAVGVGPGQHQEVLGQSGQAVGLLQGATQARLHRVVAGVQQRQLQLGPQDRHRRADLVAGVVHEGPLVGERRLHALEHGVEGATEGGDLVVAGRLGQAGVGLPQGDDGGPLAHPLDGTQGGSRQQPSAEGQPADHQRAGDGQRHREAVLGPVGRVLGGADDHQQLAALGHHRPGQQAALLTQPGHPPVDEGLPDQGAAQLSSVEQRPVGGQRGRRGHYGPGRVEHLGEPLTAADRGVTGLEGGGHIRGPAPEPGVDRVVELGGQVRVQEDEDGGQDGAGPEGEEGGQAGSQRLGQEPHGSGRSR